VLARLVDAQTQLLATLLATIADLDQAITTRLATHPKAQLLARLPRVGHISHARPSGSWAGPGCGSSGPAGTPTPPTTRPGIAPNNASPLPDLTQETQAICLERSGPCLNRK
jgi:hypothetical protein